MNKINMHIHSIASDGILTGVEIVRYAEKENLSVISITDHDSVGEIKNAIDYSKNTNVFVIPGIELTAEYSNGHCHILGYNISIEDDNKYLMKVKNSRINNSKKIIKLLKNNGFDITYDEVLKICSNGIIGRRHIARILVKHRYFFDEDEAIRLLFKKGKPYYMETEKNKIGECISLIKKCGGYSVIAHPWTLNLSLEDLKQFILNHNFDGIEVYNHNISNKLYEQLNSLADEIGLFKTCGTDYHGQKGKNDFIVDKDVDCSKILCRIRGG